MPHSAGGTNDPFSQFWANMMSSMSGGVPGVNPGAAADRGRNDGGFGPSPFGGLDEAMMRQMRQAFFDAWQKHCIEYMGSEPFLDALRQSMDGALAFKQQVDSFLKKSLHDGQMPSREDTDSILAGLRSLEDRVLNRLDDLSQRVDKLEQKPSRGGQRSPAKTGKKPRDEKP